MGVYRRAQALDKKLKKHQEHLEEFGGKHTAELKNLKKQLRKNLHELNTSKERFESLVSTIPDIIYRLDVNGKFVFLNDAVRRLGYKPEELIGKHFTETIHPLDVENASRSKVLPKFSGKITGEKYAPKLFDERRAGKRKTSGLEIRLVTKSGKRLKPGLLESLDKEVINVEVHSSGMYEINSKTTDKTFIGTVGVIRDITERKQAEKALQDAQEELARKEKLAVLGQLAGGLGHELRNPLGVIKNTAYFLKMALEKPEPEIKETLECLEKEVVTMEQIITGLLDYARAKPPIRWKVDVNNILQDILSQNDSPENIKVVCQLDKSLPDIRADSVQLGQVFGNIIHNAVQAMPSGGRLVVKSKMESPNLIAISFADTGNGISKEKLGKLFEPLFTTKAKGIGLGLAITKTLVEGHGGTIEVKSEDGKGSTFTVKLPIGQKAKQ